MNDQPAGVLGEVEPAADLAHIALDQGQPDTARGVEGVGVLRNEVRG